MRVLVVSSVLLASAAAADGQTGYSKPPPGVSAILNAPPPPDVSVSPARDRVLLTHKDRYPPIAELAEPMLKLAGLRINPATNGPSRPGRVVGFTLAALDGTKTQIPLPVGVRLGTARWSPDGKRFAALGTTEKGIGVWVYDLAAAKFTQLPGVTVNAAIGVPVQWASADELLVQSIPATRGTPPVAPPEPPGPVIQESSGKAGPVRTLQDLLQNTHDEALFSYYGTSQLAFVNVVTGGSQPVGPPAIVSGCDVSPDGKLVLLTRLNKPFSYLLSYASFPKTVEVRDRSGGVVATIADKPLQDRIPIEGVPTGPRLVQWMPTRPAGLCWVEALDGGDPRVKAEARDKVVFQPVLGKAAQSSVTLTHRQSAISTTTTIGFFEDGKRVLLKDYDRDRKWARMMVAEVAGGPPKVLFERSTQDRYGNPGTPLTRTLSNGQRVLNELGDRLLMANEGATPKGDRPWVLRYDLTTGRSVAVHECPLDEYHKVVAVLDDLGKRLLIERESPTLAPHVVFRAELGDASREVKLTEPVDPAPALRSVKREIVTTKRADGTAVNFTLFTPPGHTPGQKLPTVFYAYPTEFADGDTAGQVKGSAFRFTTFTGYSHQFFLTQGYAVMEVSMPVVGPPASANDTFVEQLVANASAAINKGAELGVVDPGRVGVMGHSYGAFMTANLLAHSDLFRAGIARSGAYNRTLTPFGFQNERRTFWEAPDVYAKMSPFNAAHNINEPLLLIHGAADNNPGTFTVQSERLYQAVRGNGGTCRLVLLPHESHGYEARESVEHVLAEQIAWFDRHVKQAGPRK
ncbi:S9 family peptidase [Urbifossiella limnaea]|uniref:Prolyl tripeptidyl peptidase n=1 Tax=Urbifossiella limnaea TaxID=2528023 RepID=A0A517XTN3_9BACT|nr:prolyl oligopeptidase family serine peptidase [Urbifossiella limnaea]QDU20876.1 Prolyl tripeptidyl peptidase precursor [Urbifossiella limnaea]